MQKQNKIHFCIPICGKNDFIATISQIISSDYINELTDFFDVKEKTCQVLKT